MIMPNDSEEAIGSEIGCQVGKCQLNLLNLSADKGQLVRADEKCNVYGEINAGRDERCPKKDRDLT